MYNESDLLEMLRKYESLIEDLMYRIIDSEKRVAYWQDQHEMAINYALDEDFYLGD